ncbi:MAG: AAA family ATPase [Chlamydiae bacterium GWC2_50_10]|nr:MAG: AAA family ATPase [Chlamydiae bacterium GWA2_50_15]OGN54795.1 MAG: AAA family ATPase [Chlamydiae bacterium GWC2_50_10]OGN58618.1 MAG: AAA family ATPase [Chlamydiae bacterium RIFCSPHIGHO2_02_FULL_49_29]OGN63826.1 MAG: AAA family ATPase [Chlamydiae bacterium RIFCSPHIGHO2_12_FULL_49_32]OGN70259.1 MAG: AAA family ATPase [Chlamydiae bacterium RIFCSPLOWO2_02_FULL_49_12]OGN72701.1 MAG: AAA family ATPase [Chlamydiae bacterium RIFCSPLOWO2_12_FULL_49_12]HAZ16035.1 AAA family ATPase [Parachlamyd
MTHSTLAQPAFGKWRSFFWPVHVFELKKLLPMFFLFFFINFNYTILRDTKDTLIVTAPGSGAEAIPFLKVWGVLPFAVLFMIIYAKLANVLSKPRLFYTLITTFISFFALFALVLYPLRESLHPNALADQLQTLLPVGFKGFIAIFRNWTFALFYIMSELWGSVAISLLFWGFANDITRVSESKRFYAMFGLGANVAMLCSGPTIIYLSNIRSKLPAHIDAWGVSLNYMITLVIFAGIMVMGIYWWINRYILTDTRFYDTSEIKKAKKEKPKLSLKESFIYLAKSKYIGCLAILVICYGVAINIVEVTWKSQVKLQYPDPNAYSAFMGAFSTFTSVATILMMLFVGGNVIRRFGWKVGALITPIVLLLTGAGFFAFVIFGKHFSGIETLLGMTPLMIAIVFGTIQNIMSKSAKYSLFDPTKEMAYIPLDQEAKWKGKAAIDVVGARLGKAGGSIIQQVLMVAFGSLAAITPYLGVILMAIIFSWIAAGRSLGKQFLSLQDKKEQEGAKEAAAVQAEAPVVLVKERATQEVTT